VFEELGICLVDEFDAVACFQVAFDIVSVAADLTAWKPAFQVMIQFTAEELDGRPVPVIRWFV